MPVERKLFIVDDDTDDIEFFCEVLHEIDEEIKCTYALNGEIALKELKESTILPDFIFADMNMPRVNGKELLKEIKATETLKHIPVIIYSTTGAENDINEIKQLGAKDFLIKPTRKDELMKQLKTVLDA